MFKGNRNLAVGLFVSIALAGVALFAMWLAGTTGNEATTRYSLLFDRDVSGLSLGGPVYYLGVAVGSVADMNLVPGDEKVRVRVDIDVLQDTPVDSGSWASLNAQGITGSTVINIAGEPGAHAPLKRTEGFDYPLIPVRQTGLSALLSQAPGTMAKIDLALDQVNDILGETNRAALASILAQADKLVSALGAESDTLAALPGDLRALSSDTRAVAQDLGELLGSARPELDSALANINKMSDNLANLAQQLDGMVANNATEFEHFIDSGLGQAPELVYDLRSALRELHNLLQQLQEDPSQLIHRPPDSALEVEP